jgi:hypothetical protein
MGMITDSQTTRVWWVPDVVDVAEAKKLTVLGAVTSFDITCMLTRASVLPAYGDDKTTSEDLVCGALEIKAIVGSTVTDGELWLVHDFDGTRKLSTTDPTTIFTGEDNQGMLVVRSGPRIETAAAVAQMADFYPMSAGRFQKSRFKDGFLKGKVKLYVLDNPSENVALVA